MEKKKIVSLYFTQEEVKEMVSHYLFEIGESKLQDHLVDNECIFEFNDEGQLYVGIDGEIPEEIKEKDTNWKEWLKGVKPKVIHAGKQLDYLDEDDSNFCLKETCDCESCQKGESECLYDEDYRYERNE
jgi:hypothetical protein